MRAFFTILAAVTILTTTMPSAARAEDENGAKGRDSTEVVPLKMKVYRNWSIRLPAEQWATVGKGFSFKDGLGADFKTHLDGTALAVDVNADGEVDLKVDSPGGYVILSRNGRRYALRVKTTNQQWHFAPGGAMTGTVEGTRIRLIDQNNNGRFDDFGEDAMIVGNGKVASLLSRVVSIDSHLFEIEIDADGQKLGYRPYAGPASVLELATVTKGKIIAAVVKSTDGKYSYGFTNGTAKMTVPAGDYALHSGTISFGGNTVKMKTGRALPVTATADGKGQISWGGPLRAEFQYSRTGSELTFDPNAIRFFGKSGEEYYAWAPLGKSPKISLHTKSGREIAEAYFPGSC